ncbi:MAG: hypothetical protein HON02_05705 [Rhodospirillaceae bacterium]|nr:hypothetical protein [Rhodospirillaceae bacterium]
MLLLVVLTTAACDSMEIPYVTPPLESRLAPKVQVAKVTDVRVELVQGPALPMAKLLSSSVTAGLNDHGVNSTIREGELSRFVLKGRAEANWEDRRVPFVMLIYWTLTDLNGKLIGEYTQGVRGARWKWEYGDPRIIRAVGNGAAKPLAAMIVEEEDEALPVLLLGAGILVEPVIGAPGDGNRALRKGIIDALRKADVSITEDRRQASVTLSGQVSVQPAGSGRDKVFIVWRIRTLDGFEMGRATQENAVPSGQLQGPWGEDAEKIAEAAVIGLERILGSGTGRRAPSVIDPGGSPPPSPELEKIPGRAPPPPE